MSRIPIIAALALGAVSVGVYADERLGPLQVLDAHGPLVDLRNPGALAALQAADPARYREVRRVLAAAPDLCKPAPPAVKFAALRVSQVSCLGMMLLTSNPPKHELSFRLDDTRYLALVTVAGAEPTLHPAVAPHAEKSPG